MLNYINTVSTNNPFSLSFTRKLIVSFQSWIFDSISYPRFDVDSNTVHDDQLRIYYAMGGNWQYVQDFFLEVDEYYTELSCNKEGKYNQIPFGIFYMSNMSRDDSESVSRYEPVKFDVTNGDDRTTSTWAATAEIIPIKMDVDVKIKCHNNMERFIISESLMMNLSRPRIFRMGWNGYNKIPVVVKFPESYDNTPNMDYSLPVNENDKNPILEFQVEILSYMVKRDKETAVKYDDEL